MKTIRIIFRKERAQAVCTMRFRHADCIEDAEWSGDLDAFSLANGYRPDHFGTLYGLGRIANHFASLCGATCEIHDLGGEAPFLHL
jgi:hypothetical protein